MYRGKRVSVAIPCLNEEKLIKKTLDNVPDFIGKIYVIDDGSTDKTSEVVRKYAKNDKRVELLVNAKNMGNGYSVVRAFKEAIKDGYDVNCIVAGDNQCRQEYLQQMVDEVIDNRCDYAKANRFAHAAELRQMPVFRRHANIFMSFINKFATGYYSIFDPLNSFSATRVSTLAMLDLDAISPRYDFENSYLLHMYLVNARVKDIPVPALYGDERSTIKLLPYTYRTSRTLFRSFWQRIYYRYIMFLHPIAIFFLVGLALFLIGLTYGLIILFSAMQPGHEPASTATVMIFVVPFILGIQFLLQAIVLDIQNEPK